ncbi:MAG TPA: protease pro-enzyme activation domain-containing protein [Fimbriimonas sp.]|nr:protease pro-enzyme activation domain-containing protein [Fimbriimonas sp.]
MALVPAISHSTRLGPIPASQILHINVCLSEAKPGALQAFVDDVSNPLSAHYREFLSPADIGAKFGQPLSVVGKVATYLKSYGMKVTRQGTDNLHVTADATAAQVKAAFGAEIDNYRSNDPHEVGNVNYFAYSQAPQMPSDVAALVGYIGGLQSWNKRVPATTLSPNMAATLYHTTPIMNLGVQGQGRTIAFSNWDGFRVSNVPLYVDHFGLPAPSGGAGSNVKIVPIDGGSGAGYPGGEGDLDLQMLVGQAPLSAVLIYDGGDLLNVLTREVSDNQADIISESWSWGFDTGTGNAAHTLHLEMSAEGITYLTASGDWGTSLLNESFVYYPQIEPEVTVVGGTAAQTDSNGNRLSEVGWFGSGGGWSPVSYPWNVLPAWQKGTGVPTNVNYRMLPDISAQSVGDAAFTTNAVYIYYNGALSSISGTSASSPMQAGQLAIAEQRLIQLKVLPPDKYGHSRFGRLNDRIYKMNGRPDVWYDVTVGDNGPLPNGNESRAGSGWDTVTGWGCPNWTAFVGAIQPPIMVRPSSAVIYAGPPVQGTNATGTAVSLSAVDNIGYSVQSVTASAGQVAAEQISFALTTPPSNLTGLGLTLVTKAPSTVTQFVYLFNYRTNQWDTSTAWTSAMNGSNKTLNVAIDVSKYVGPSNTVKVINRGVQPPRLGPSPYRLTTDQAILVESF